VIPIGVVFIFIFWTIFLFRKSRRGESLNREERILAYTSLIIFGIIDSFGLVLTFFEWNNITPAILQPYANFIIIFLILGSMGIVGILWLLLKTRKKSIINSSIFMDVKIFYDYNKFKSDAYYSVDPKYIANKRTGKVYLIPNDFIEKYVRTQAITSREAYSSDEKLRADLLSKGYSFIPREAKLRYLDIYCSPSGRLRVIQNIDASTLAKLKEKKEQGKFKDYQLVFIYPWWHRFFKKSSSRFSHLLTECYLIMIQELLAPHQSGTSGYMTTRLFNLVNNANIFRLKR
jgi:hypothetical protein